MYFRLPEPGKNKKGANVADEASTAATPRPEVSRNGVEMIGDLRTDAQHEVLAQAGIFFFSLMGIFNFYNCNLSSAAI
ncbi:hypothetical protein BLTE_07010 [Blastochloris tepida]|uniref:Uncharacterized protein n=1 Tax=Blastochloris tepida TaxID=2233851 RepID=A0A348FXI3_9HYPH|nr:hypothetical protein BLTE_07010 [Blastochloris tepida]